MSDHDSNGRYSMILEWEPQGAVYVVTVPELPGCRTHGKTLSEAVRRGLEVTEGWIESAREWGEPVPPPKHFVLEPVEESPSDDEDGVDASAEECEDSDDSLDSATDGEHIFWRHPLLPGEYVTITGDDDDDALPYQEREVQRLLANVRNLAKGAVQR